MIKTRRLDLQVSHTKSLSRPAKLSRVSSGDESVEFGKSIVHFWFGKKLPEEWRTFYVSASLWRIDFDKRVAEQAVMSNLGCPGGFGEH